MSEKKIKFLGIPVSLKRDSIEFSCKIGKLNLWNVSIDWIIGCQNK